jgi:uncharacterized membrane protein/subtilisin family serine protease
LATAAPSGDVGDGPLSRQGSTSDDPVYLYLKAGTFDPKNDDGPAPLWLRAEFSHPYYIIQFDGPIQKEWRDAVTDTGAELLAYLPDFAYFARIPEVAIRAINDLDHLRYLGPAHPAYRVDPSLWVPSLDPTDLVITTWGVGASERVAASVSREGWAIIAVDDDRVITRAPPAMALQLSLDPTMAVSWIEPYFFPELMLNNDARTSLARQNGDGAYQAINQTAWAYDRNSDSFGGWTGEGVTVSVGDTGLDTDHPAFTGRISRYYDYPNDGQADYHGHGTHVAGIVLGDGSWRSSDTGLDGKYIGIAPEASLVVQEVMSGYGTVARWNRDATRAGATISSNSWGAGAFGNYYDICRAYDDHTRDSDSLTQGDQPILFTFSAGNDGSYGANSVTPPATAKNIITVGATGNDRWGLSHNSVAGFSSRGPTDDGRLKPDVVIPGHMVASARSTDGNAGSGWARPSDGQTSYVYASGTSMSAPGVAGAAAVLTQYLVEEKGMEDPSPAMLKASLINGARPLTGYEYPGMVQGWGTVDMAKTLFEPGTYRIYREDQAVEMDSATGADLETLWFKVEPDQPLKISLVWTDPGGTSSASKTLINDLDLEVISPTGDRYGGNNFENGHSISDEGFQDRVNNVEGILIDAPASGFWTINIKAFNIPQGPQDYALVVSGNVEKGHIDILPISLSATPRDLEEFGTAHLTTVIKNTGNRMSDTFDWKVEQVDPDGTTTVLDEGNNTGLDAGKQTEMGWDFSGKRGTHILRVTLDPDKLIQESNKTNNVLEVEYFFKGYGVGLSAAEDELGTDPGVLVEFAITVRNRGNVPDEFKVTISEAPTRWTIQLVTDKVQLGAGQRTSVLVSMIPPSNATAGERADILFTAVSLGNTGKTKTITITTTVNQIFGLELGAGASHLELLPGDEGDYTLVISNPGNGQDRYEVITHDVESGWWPVVPEPIVIIPHRDQVNAVVRLSSPDPSPAGSTTRFSVTVKSSKSSMEKTVSLTAEIIQFFKNDYEVLLRDRDAEVGTTVVVPVSIENNGNGPVEYTFSTKAPTSEWKAGFEIPSATIGGYGWRTVNMSFTLPEGAVNQSYDLSIVAMPTGGNILQYNFSFAVRQYHAMELSIISSTGQVTQGMPMEVKVRLNNQGNGVERAKVLFPELPAYWSIEMDSSQIEVAPFDNIDLTLTINTSKETPGGVYDVGVSARYGPSPQATTGDATTVTVVTRPDLRVVQGVLTLSEVEPIEGSMIQLSIDIENVGQTPAGDIYVQFYVDAFPIGQPLYIGLLEPEGTQILTTTWMANTTGLHQVSVLVDSTKDVDEIQEDNNQAFAQVSVQKVSLKTSPGFGPFLLLAAFATIVVLVRRRH